MGLAKVEKIEIACHKDHRKEFLSELQEQGIIHITRVSEPSKVESDEEIRRRRDGLSKTIDLLSGFVEKRGLLAGLLTHKVRVSNRELLSLVKGYDFKKVMERAEELNRTLSSLDSEKKRIISQTETLLPWSSLPYKISELYKLKRVEVLLGTFGKREEFDKVWEKVQNRPVDIKIISEEKGKLYCLVIAHRGIEAEIKSLLMSSNFEIIELEGIENSPKEEIERLKGSIERIERRREEVLKEISLLISELPKLRVLYDYYQNLLIREETQSNFLFTSNTFLIEGWIRKKDMRKLKSLLERFPYTSFTPVKPKEGESPPVVLENKRLFKPFELVIDLYGMPKPNEVDPTPLLAPFFALFFGLCITDAGYGIILLILSIILLKRLKMGEKLLKMMAIGGVATILAGAITGGWFGDLPQRIGLAGFANKLLLFDPFKTPLIFFVLSLTLGYIQVNYGILIEVYDSFRNREYGRAIFENLSWFIILNGVLALVATKFKFLPSSLTPYLFILVLLSISSIILFTRRSRRDILGQILWFNLLFFGLLAIMSRFGILSFRPSLYLFWGFSIAIFIENFYLFSKTKPLSPLKFGIFSLVPLTSVLSLLHYTSPILPFLFGILFIFSLPHNRPLLKRIIFGLYTLYGSTTFINAVISYIRLMALGMVTGGIAMAINIIVWMVLKVPGIGIILGILIFIAGHLFNIAINTLGGFIHTFRLQYVEFFPRFFTGGGKKFSPFRIETKYTSITERR